MRRIATLAVIGAFAAPGTALAADSGYGAAEGVTGGPPTTTTSSSNQLPFTGLDVLPMLAAGIVLVGAGFGLARAGRRDESEHS